MARREYGEERESDQRPGCGTVILFAIAGVVALCMAMPYFA